MKPLWFAKEGSEWALSSYKSCIERVGFDDPTQVEEFHIRAEDVYTELLERRDVYTFDLEQKKTTYDDWESAFSEAIAKRTRNIKHVSS